MYSKSELLELLDNLKENYYSYVDDAIAAIRELDAYNTIIDSDELNYIIEKRASEYGWRSVLNTLIELDGYLSDDYYQMDGYENAKPLKCDDVIEMLQNVINDMEDDNE